MLVLVTGGSAASLLDTDYYGARKESNDACVHFLAVIGGRAGEVN